MQTALVLRSQGWGKWKILTSLLFMVMICVKLIVDVQIFEFQRHSFRSKIDEVPILRFQDNVQLQTASRDKLPALFFNYIEKHKSDRQCLTDSKCNKDNVRILVWHCPIRKGGRCAGIGDRLRGLQFAYFLAVLTGRLFLVDWPKNPFALEYALEPSFVDWRMPFNLTEHDWYELPWYKCISPRPCTENGLMPNSSHLPFLNRSHSDIDILLDDIANRLLPYSNVSISTRMRPDAISALMNNKHILRKYPELESYSEKIQRFLLSSLFKPSRYVESSIRQIIPKSVLRNGYISIHTRTGFDVGEGHSRRFRAMNNNISMYAENMLKCSLSVVKFPRALVDSKNIFLASDSLPFKKIFQEQAKQYNLSVFSSNHAALHIGLRNEKFRTISSSDQWVAFINIFVDFVALSRGKLIILNGSGFSKMAFNFGTSFKLIDLSIASSSHVDHVCSFFQT